MEQKKQLPKFLADSFEVLMESLSEKDQARVAQLLESADERAFIKISEILDQAFPEVTREVLSPEEERDISIETAISFLDAGDHYSAREFAARALTADSHCVESLFVLADTASGPFERVFFASQILSTEAARLGANRLNDPEYPFWQDIETRNYLRALHMRGVSLCDALDYGGAIPSLQECLERDPEDHLNARSALLEAYLATKNIGAADDLLAQYSEEVSCGWLFGKALRTFVGSDDLGRAEAELRLAHEYNPYVLKLLLSSKRQLQFPESYRPGSLEEAEVYVTESGALWDAIDGAISWLSTVDLPAPRPRGRKRKGS